MVPLFGWIFVSFCTTLTIFELYWDTSRRIDQQKEQDQQIEHSRGKQPFFPTWSWVRMCSQCTLCLLNIWISITTFDTTYFWIFISISAIVLLMDMQLKCVKKNALYLQVKYGSKLNPIGMAILWISGTLMILICGLFNIYTYTQWINLSIPFSTAISFFWNFILTNHFICHCIHFKIYCKLTYLVVYSDAQLSGNIHSFDRMYSWRISGIVYRITVLFVLIMLFVFQNLYGTQYLFYLYIYPICILILQIANFQSDYRNTITFPDFCKNWYSNHVQSIFDKELAKRRNKVESTEEKEPLRDV